MYGVRRMRVTGAAALALAAVSTFGAAAFAQSPKEQNAAPVDSRPPQAGELWSVSTVQEIYGPRDREPTKTDRLQHMICFGSGKVDINSAANADLPPELKDKCWLSDKRSDANRQQTKYACNDGTSAEVATRKEADGSYGSQVVVNVPEKGGIAVTRTMRRMPGGCDPSKLTANPPAPPASPARPATPETGALPK